MTIPVLKTPDEYITYYTNMLKDSLSSYDIQVNKLGVIGYFMNILGWTQYDNKMYADHLFKEAFVATARTESNLFTHSYSYGYYPGLAIPSKAFGDMVFDFELMPTPQTGVTKREIVFKDIKFKISDYIFQTDSEYRFIEEISGSERIYYSVVSNSKETKYIPSTTSLIRSPFLDIYQIVSEVTEVMIQQYEFGTFYPYTFMLDSGFLSNLKVEITSNPVLDQSIWTNYEIKNVKYLEDSYSKTVFLHNVDSKNYMLEFGSGTRGNYIPNSVAKLTITNTLGKSGNLNTEATTTVMTGATVTVVQVLNNEITTLGLNVKDILKVNFFYSEGGSDTLTGDDLRKSVIKYIQSRDNLISRSDYYNINSKYATDFEFTFKKSSFIDNVFYLSKCIRDKYQTPIKTLNHTHQLQTIYKVPLSGLQGISLYNEHYSLTLGTYKYSIVATDNFEEFIQNEIDETTNTSNIVYVEIDSNHNASSLSWDITPGAIKYKVYREIPKQNPLDLNEDQLYYYWETYNNSLIDDGTNTVIYRKVFSSSKIVFFPTFKFNDIEFISPFVYDYNLNMNWYASNIIYENFLVYLDKITVNENRIRTDIVIPTIYFNIVYDRFLAKTFIYLKSHQNLSFEMIDRIQDPTDSTLYLDRIITGYVFKLTIPELNIYDKYFNEVIVDPNSTLVHNTFIYEIDNLDGSYGLLRDNITIGLEILAETRITTFGYETASEYILLANGITGIFKQTHSISDSMKLLTYTDIDNNVNLTNIPLIDKNEYLSDIIYYNDKIKEFTLTSNLKENRLVADEVNIQFFNNFLVKSDILEPLLKQSYDYDIQLPLKIKVECYINQQTVIDNEVNVSSERENLIISLAERLQSTYTGVNLRYYNSQIIDFIHTDRSYIKKVVVTVTDSSTVPNIILDGIETNDVGTALTNIMEKPLFISPDPVPTDAEKRIIIGGRKKLIVKFTPVFWHWDINHIDLKFFF